MYLKKLEMSGFKSFAGKTVLDFAFENGEKTRGVTAIVGPNGSGKSNVADAIRWALGEQSSKNLRGKKSEDMIFSGSGTKARLGGASVSLIFDNEDKRIPIEFSEVTMTRKLFRSGESEYWLNGSRARLLDIIDLLAKAGVGKDSYCVITQGMSDAILNATPPERRAIFEDAAGVKQYQLRKERSLRKMKSTEENLLRVNGLVAEIEPHLKNLKRLADKASKGKETAAELREKQERLLGFLWYRFEDERSGLAIKRDALLQAAEASNQEVSSLEAAISSELQAVQNSGESLIDEAQKRIRELREKQSEIEREIATLDGRMIAEKERRIPKEEIRSIPVDLNYVRTRLTEVRKDQEVLIERLGNVENLSELQDLRELARVIQTRMFELHEEAGKGAVVTKRLIGLSDEALAASDRQLSEWKKRRDLCEETRVHFAEEMKRREQSIDEEQEKQRVDREKRFSLERNLREKQNALNITKDALNEARVRLARVEVREEDLTARIAQELSIAPAQLARYDEALDEASLEREIARLKVQLEHIGSIDPLIVDEYRETQERFEFLTRESDDLGRALVSLRGIVRDMNVKIRTEFETAFERIEKEFAHYFALIFGGGKAELLKTKSKTVRNEDEEGIDAADDAASEGEEISNDLGIEIFACPPGKKIHHLSMLSGGERTLTSLALLFAIIAYNPPPFVVLDEVEAALDEANSRRFGRVLRELSHRTQFVAITHNRETMRQAALLYGVTMGENGVSQILSLRLGTLPPDDDRG